ncbi:MAG: hypothetical protein KF836_09480 [Fimbriimonadaceae bacterium]|nr:hypothetical protein [Fimbriimonadaceae bacterium]
MINKSGAKNPLKPLLGAVRQAEKSRDVEQVKSARQNLYEVAARIRSQVQEATKGKKGIDKWRMVKSALGG